MNVQNDMDWFDIMSKDGEVMNNELFLELASKEVREYVLEHLPKDGNTSEFEVFTMWSCGCGNDFDALLKTNLNNDMYYEVTYLGETSEMQLNVFNKIETKKLN